MRFARVILALIVLAAISPLTAGDLPPAKQAEFLSIISRGAGAGGKVDCHFDPVLAKGFGSNNDPSSKVGWGTTAAQVKALKAEKKLVVCPNVELLTKGGCIAIIEVDGKPQMVANFDEIDASGIPLSDIIKKLAKRL